MPSVGGADGAKVGGRVGFFVGSMVVGERVGLFVGEFVGEDVGKALERQVHWTGSTWLFVGCKTTDQTNCYGFKK